MIWYPQLQYYSSCCCAAAESPLIYAFPANQQVRSSHAAGTGPSGALGYIPIICVVAVPGHYPGQVPELIQPAAVTPSLPVTASTGPAPGANLSYAGSTSMLGLPSVNSSMLAAQGLPPGTHPSLLAAQASELSSAETSVRPAAPAAAQPLEGTVQAQAASTAPGGVAGAAHVPMPGSSKPFAAQPQAGRTNPRVLLPIVLRPHPGSNATPPELQAYSEQQLLLMIAAQRQQREQQAMQQLAAQQPPPQQPLPQQQQEVDEGPSIVAMQRQQQAVLRQAEDRK